MRVDPRTEELIRRWPVPIARALNFVIRWTDEYCYGGCGRPVTGRLYHVVETYEGTRILASLCAVEGECQRRVEEDPRDEAGRSYADIRPIIIEQIVLADEPGTVHLSYGR